MNLVHVSTVASFEAFLEDTCRNALETNHNLLGQFDPSISWKDVPPEGDVDPLWETLINKALSEMQSGRLRTYAKVFKKLGVQDMETGAGSSSALAEVFARRNAIVHNSGKPDARYLTTYEDTKTYPSGGLVIDVDYVDGVSELLVRTAENAWNDLVRLERIPDVGA